MAFSSTMRQSMESTYRQKYLDNLARGVEGMWLKQRYTDVTVKAGSKAYGAHRVLLGSMSNYFKELFMHNHEDNVEVSSVESQTFEIVLQYIYTGKTDAVKANLESVLSAAVKLQIPCLQEICEDFLAVRLTPETCVGIFKLASGLGCASLTKQSRAYMLEYFESVVKCKEFMNLSAEELTAVINDDDLNTPSEEIVCEAVLGWIAADPVQRCQFLDKLFNVVRFPLFSEKYLQNLKGNDIIAKSESGQRILKEITSYMNTGLPATTVNPRQFHHRTEELICVVGTRSRQPNPETTEVKCFSFNKEMEYNLASIPEEPGACYAVCTNTNDLYLSGGYLGQKRMLRFLATENKWNLCADMKEGRWGHSMTAVDGLIYIIGGSKKIPEPIAAIEMYNAGSDTTLIVGTLEIPVSFAAVASLGDKVYIFGGKLENRNICGKVQCFDTVTRSCKVVCDMPRVDSTVGRTAVIDNIIYIFYNQGEVVMFKEDHAPEIVASGVAFDHFGVVVHGGRVLIDGSYGNQYSTVVFDPVTRVIEPYSRTVKAALCNFYCMPIVISKNILQSSMK
ncbi:kelch-like protein 24 [Mercenaria mercenaria]|uniref:kelch-like protein 24 n=1 Tax=Mercenaria mercenaria TaxID=6596 RepID=UPI00234F31E2|nr:kelch-like protein 24 [Mercenaria mercenaria]